MNLGSVKWLAKNILNSYDKINNISYLLLVIHGTGDEIIPYELGVKPYKKYENQKKLLAFLEEIITIWNTLIAFYITTQSKKLSKLYNRFKKRHLFISFQIARCRINYSIGNACFIHNEVKNAFRYDCSRKERCL